MTTPSTTSSKIDKDKLVTNSIKVERPPTPKMDVMEVVDSPREESDVQEMPAPVEAKTPSKKVLNDADHQWLGDKVRLNLSILPHD